MRILFVLLISITWIPGALGQVSSYDSDSVHFTKDSLRYGATLTRPEGKQSCYGIVLISGTGKQGRDGTMAGHPVRVYELVWPMFLYQLTSQSSQELIVLKKNVTNLCQICDGIPENL